MAWAVRFTAAAEKQLSKLDRPVQRRILEFLEEIAQGDPRGKGKAMRGDAHAWRYRVWAITGLSVTWSSVSLWSM